GSISLVSSPGKGACFTIRLPVGLVDEASNGETDALLEAAQDQRQRNEGFAGLSSGTADSRKARKIMLVDDDRTFLELAERLLIKEGFSPIATDAPESVLQVARTVRPAAILIDILMPGL